MKPLLLTIIAGVFTLNLYSQSSIQWKVVDNNNEDYKFHQIIQTGDSEQKTVFTIPHNKPFKKTKFSIFIRKYNADLSNFTEDGIPPESPHSVAIKGFRNYNVIYGSMDENISIGDYLSEPNRIVITDNLMNPLVTQTFRLHNSHNRFESIPEIIISADSNYLIIVNSEIITPNKVDYKLDFKDTYSNYYVDVYDKNLNHVWNDSVMYKNLFPNTKDVNDFNFNFINGKLVVTASYANLTWGKPKPVIYVFVYDKPQSFKLITRKEFTEQGLAYNTVFDKSGKIFFSGCTMHLAAVGGINPGNSKNQLFYLSVDINDPEKEPVFKSYYIDDNFYDKYPKQNLIFDSYFIFPDKLIYNNNKLYYVSDHCSKNNSANGYPTITYHFDQLFIMAFDSDGKIDWINSINKRTVITVNNDVSRPVCKVIVNGNDLSIFYFDNSKNVYSDNLKTQGNSLKNLCVVNAIVSPKGVINKTIISNVNDTKVIADLSQTRMLNGKTYLFAGKGATLKNMNDYFGLYKTEK